MYFKNGVVYKLINIELVVKEPIFIGKKLYQDIANRLIDHKVIISEPVIDEYPCNDETVSLVIHASNPSNPENVILPNVKKALAGLLDNYPCYSGIKITLK